MYIDTHCHVSKLYYDNLDKLVIEIKEAGIKYVIINGTDLKSNIEVLELIKKYDIFYGAIGFHPTEIKELDENNFKWLIEHINDNKIVAIGEIGLDYHYENTNKELQHKYFKRQLDIAKEYNKPVIVHCRDAIQDIFDMLSLYNLNGVIHSFSGSLEMANKFIGLGYKIGIGGVCTFKNSICIKNIVRNIDLKYILLETDSPYLTPEPFRGKINSSKYIPLIASQIANIKNIKLEDVALITSNNAINVFKF